jgi:hypothetical protein
MNYGSSDSTAAAGGVVLAALLIPIIISLAITIFILICNWRIVSKAGYSGALSLLMLIPIANIIVYIIFAFSKWPIQQELELRRSQQGGVPASGPPPAYPQQYR